LGYASCRRVPSKDRQPHGRYEADTAPAANVNGSPEKRPYRNRRSPKRIRPFSRVLLRRFRSKLALYAKVQLEMRINCRINLLELSLGTKLVKWSAGSAVVTCALRIARMRRAAKRIRRESSLGQQFRHLLIHRRAPQLPTDGGHDHRARILSPLERLLASVIGTAPHTIKSPLLKLRNGRFNKDYENMVQTSETMSGIPIIRNMLNRFAPASHFSNSHERPSLLDRDGGFATHRPCGTLSEFSI
jgi:hypothetical protein